MVILGCQTLGSRVTPNSPPEAPSSCHRPHCTTEKTPGPGKHEQHLNAISREQDYHRKRRHPLPMATLTATKPPYGQRFGKPADFVT
ncbi:hypothetical protein E2C01_057836 [Portunus trituberculatus]|uniref:Uncharacterized protein n=1 Tax=Portunus trituberculatus TaxID=210409 RepID=A0A5B7H4H0_PORTR|nr:hypothetical protein [Portunus trituberculatus]